MAFEKKTTSLIFKHIKKIIFIKKINRQGKRFMKERKIKRRKVHMQKRKKKVIKIEKECPPAFFGTGINKKYIKHFNISPHYFYNYNNSKHQILKSTFNFFQLPIKNPNVLFK